MGKLSDIKFSDMKNNPIIKSILLIIIVLYTTMAAPRMSPSVLKIFQNPFVKIFCLFLILFFANVNPLYALASSVILFVTLQILRDFETSMYIKCVKTGNLDSLKNGLLHSSDTVHDSTTAPVQNTDNVNEDEYTKLKLELSMYLTQALKESLNEIENEKKLETQAIQQNNTRGIEKHKYNIVMYEQMIQIINTINTFQKETEYSNNANTQYLTNVIDTQIGMVDAYWKSINHNNALYEENIQTNSDKLNYHEIEKNKMEVIINASELKLNYLNKLNNAKVNNNNDDIKLLESLILRISMKINALINSSILKEESFKAKMNGDIDNSNKLYRESIIQELKAKSIINSDYLNSVANQLLMKGDKESAQQFINDSNNELEVAGTIEECEQHYNIAKTAEQLGDDEKYKTHINEYNKLQCKINDEYIINYNNGDFMNADNKYVSIANDIISGNKSNIEVYNRCNLNNNNSKHKNDHSDNQNSNNLNITGYSSNNNYALVN